MANKILVKSKGVSVFHDSAASALADLGYILVGTDGSYKLLPYGVSFGKTSFEFDGESFEFTYRPFEVKTFRIF